MLESTLSRLNLWQTLRFAKGLQTLPPASGLTTCGFRRIPKRRQIIPQHRMNVNLILDDFSGFIAHLFDLVRLMK